MTFTGELAPSPIKKEGRLMPPLFFYVKLSPTLRERD
jgi:hypothetical protein